jgi:hypothetical protein
LWVKPAEGVVACLDPGDDIFLECAEAARADYLITGNLNYFPTSWKKTKLVTARRLLEIITAEKTVYNGANSSWTSAEIFLCFGLRAFFGTITLSWGG